MANQAVTESTIIDRIFLIRGQKVMLDRDLSLLYSVETRVLNQAVKRNEKRFPPDFMFQLTREELDNWKSQIVTSNKERMGLRKLPLAFTEQGIAMLSSVLNSETAIGVNIQIIRTFTRIRQSLLLNKDLLLRLEQLQNKIMNQGGRLDKTEENVELIFEVLKKLLRPPSAPRPGIGFRRENEND